MVEALRKLSRMAWRIDWLSPLASDPAYRPETEGLAAVLPYLDRLEDGASIQSLCDHMLNLSRAA